MRSLVSWLALVGAASGQGLFNGSRAVAPPLHVLLVRVPKTASDTVESSLLAWQRAGLCNIDVQAIHVPTNLRARPTADVVQAADKVIITNRDPVARFVSAFNWRHPWNSPLTHNTAQSPDAYPFEEELYSCFWHVNDLADALVRSFRSAANRTRCEQLAWAACKTDPTWGNVHLSMIQAGLTSYVATAGLSTYLSRPLFVVHVEDFKADLHRLFTFLECDHSRLPASGLPIISKHEAYEGSNRTELSSMGQLLLRMALHHDYVSMYSLETGLAPSGW
jgi:hypothetical protein